MVKKLLFLTGLLYSFLLSSQSLNMEYEYADWFDAIIGRDNIGLYEGSLYSIGVKSKDSHPFFGDRNGYVGDIVYKGQLFRNVHLLYDLTKDQFLLTCPNKFSFTELILINQSEISSIRFGKYTFASKTIHGKKGFYEILFAGATGIEVLGKHKKTGLVTGMKYTYHPESIYFIRTNKSDYIPFKKKLIYLLYPEHKKKIRKFIESNNLIITNENPDDLVILAHYLTRMNFE